MKKILFLSFLLSAVVRFSAAEAIDTIGMASEFEVAQQWLQSQGVDSIDGLLAEQVTDYYCVLNGRNKPCFAIVARQEFWSELDSPILAYGTDERFSYRANPQSKHYFAFIHQYDLQLASLSDPVRAGEVCYHPQHEEVKPLLGKTVWGQRAPYNQLTVPVHGKHSPVGCVPVAVGQVMHYYAWPECGRYHSFYKGPNQQMLQVNFSSYHPAWSQIGDRYQPADSLEARETATFLSFCGMGLDAVYGEQATSVNLNNIKDFLVNNMSYSGTTNLQDKLAENEIVAALYHELDASRPVIVGGAAHAFVIDGYQGGFFHLNLGWGGICNGYYRLTLKAPAAVRSPHLMFTSLVTGISPMRETVSRTVTLTKKLRLADVLSEEEKATVTHLTVSGPLRSDDVRLLRQMAQRTLISLNLRHAQITNDKKPFATYPATYTWNKKKYDMRDMASAAKWRDFCSKVGTDHDGFIYRRENGVVYADCYLMRNWVSTYMFRDCTSLQRLVLPESTTYIQMAAIVDCSCLCTLNLPEKVRKVEKHAVTHCRALDEVTYFVDTELVPGAFHRLSPVFKAARAVN